MFEVLAPHLRSSLREGKKTTQWTDNWCARLRFFDNASYAHSSLCSCPRSAEHLRRLHAEGFTQKDVEAALHTLPIVRPRSSPVVFLLQSGRLTAGT